VFIENKTIAIESKDKMTITNRGREENTQESQIEVKGKQFLK
jgi:hypothetical protein